MVLTTRTEGALRRTFRASRHTGERGSQSMELVMVLPMVVVTVLLVCGAGLLGADLIAAQGLARDAARTAAVGEVAEVQATVSRAAGRRSVELDLSPPRPRPGETVTATVRLRSIAFRAVGVEVWLPARVSMRVEEP